MGTLPQFYQPHGRMLPSRPGGCFGPGKVGLFDCPMHTHIADVIGNAVHLMRVVTGRSVGGNFKIVVVRAAARAALAALRRAQSRNVAPISWRTHSAFRS